MWQRRCGSIWWGRRQREAVLGSHGQVGGGAAMARSRWSLASSELSVIPVRRGERRCFPGDAGLGFLRGEAGLIVARSFLGVGDGRCGQSWTWPEVLVGCGPSCRLGVDGVAAVSLPGGRSLVLGYAATSASAAVAAV